MKCFSGDDLHDGRDPVTQRRDLPRAASWPQSGGDVNGEKRRKTNDRGKDERSLINRSVSHDPFAPPNLQKGKPWELGG